MTLNEEKNVFVNNIIANMNNMSSEEFTEKIYDFLFSHSNGGKLYKYRSFDRKGHSLSNLKNNTLYFSSPADFNDPFDCKLGFDITGLMNEELNYESIEFQKYWLKFCDYMKENITDKECTVIEKEIFAIWKNEKNLVEYMHIQNDLENTDKYLENHFSIVLTAIEPIISHDELKDKFPMAAFIFFYMTNPDDLNIQCNDNENCSLIRLEAHNLGIDNDTDEISLIKIISEHMTPTMMKTMFSDQITEMGKISERLNQSEFTVNTEIQDTFRVCSLCDDYKNPLMWSHYADGHKGFCIEYDLTAKPELDKIALLPVIYDAERVKCPWEVTFEGRNKDQKALDSASKKIEKALLVKDENWKYEGEWRFISSNKGKKNISMLPISCIYVGAMCSEKNKKKILQIAKKKNIPVKQMKVDRGQYKLHAEQIN